MGAGESSQRNASLCVGIVLYVWLHLSLSSLNNPPRISDELAKIIKMVTKDIVDLTIIYIGIQVHD